MDITLSSELAAATSTLRREFGHPDGVTLPKN